MKFYCLIMVSVLLTACTEEKVVTYPPSEVFKKGESTPLEVIYFEPKNNEPSKYYLSFFTLTSENEGIISITDITTRERVLEYSLNVNKPGLQTTSTTEQNQELNDFVFQNYSEWCGRWHHGIRRDWQFCTGDDCGGEGSVRWCIRTRPRPGSN